VELQVSLATVTTNTIFIETETKILTNRLSDYSVQDNLSIDLLSNITDLERHMTEGF
jgi:hypothetical protein